MATRCITEFRDGDHLVALLYRSMDGWPYHHGVDLVRLLRGRKVVGSAWGRTCDFESFGDLTIRVIAGLKQLTGERLAKWWTDPVWEQGRSAWDYAGLLGLLPLAEKDRSVDFFYRVWSTTDGLVWLQIEAPPSGRLLYSGSVDQFHISKRTGAVLPSPKDGRYWPPPLWERDESDAAPPVDDGRRLIRLKD
jgi:hypothetical protein